MNIIVAIVVFVILVTAFLSTYLMNKRTPIPKGIDLREVHCHGCKMVECQHNEAHRKGEGE